MKLIDIINEEIHNLINENTYKVYHGTNQKFSKFNLNYSTHGIIWFTDSLDSIKNSEHGGQGNKYIMTRYITINNPAGWEEYEKYGLQQLQDMGYDGVILPQGNKTDYFVFSSKNISAKPIKENIDLYEGINVFHGSDRKFDDFDFQKIGSGDGKNLGGWGIYFSNDEEVSNRYVTASGFIGEYQLKSGRYFDLDEVLTDGDRIVDELQNIGVDENQIEEFRSDYIEYAQNYGSVTNKQAYDWLSYVLGGEKQASLFLNKLGYIGNTMMDKWKTTARNYIVYDKNAILKL